jgi:hypothetical protein
LNQQKLDVATTHPVTHRGYLVAIAQPAKMRQGNESSCLRACGGL